MLPTYTVSEFLAQINGIIAGQFTVEGEVSQFKVNQGKFVFFDLKDATGLISCFMMLFKLKQPLEDGMKIKITGYPRVREQTGRFGFTVEQVELVGDGTLKRAYELLKKKLAEEGLFASERKRAIPRLPERIGVIASSTSAAFGDFKRILTNRWGGVEVVLRDVTVQGATAIGEIVTAFKEFNEQAGQFDVLVLIRGGGSLEDLAAFNSEEVARAVYGSRIPVVCGVGHERDESLADFVADVRASTPSNAAELVVPDKRDMLQELSFDVEQMGSALSHRLFMQRQSVDTLFYRMSSRLEAPLARLRQTINLFASSFLRLEKKFARYFDFVTSSERLLQNVNPRRVLQRGYSITRQKGAVIKAADQLDDAENFVVELGRGTVTGKVVS